MSAPHLLWPVRSRALAGLALTALTALAAAPARAQQVLYSNAPDLTPTQDGSCVYNTTCGLRMFAAQRFTLSGPAAVTGFGYNAVVRSGVYGTSVNYQVLTATVGGAPGTVLVSGTAALTYADGPTGASFATTNYSFVVPTLPLLSGDYFLAFQDVTKNFSDYLSLGTAGGGAYQSDDGGVTYAAGYGAGRQLNSVAITVSGTPVVASVPEPDTWALLGTGLLAVGGAARRRRTRVA